MRMQKNGEFSQTHMARKFASNQSDKFSILSDDASSSPIKNTISVSSYAESESGQSDMDLIAMLANAEVESPRSASTAHTSDFANDITKSSMSAGNPLAVSTTAVESDTKISRK